MELYFYIPLTYFIGIAFHAILDIHDTRISSALDKTMKKITLNYQYLVLIVNLILFLLSFYVCYSFKLSLLLELVMVTIINFITTLVLAKYNNHKMIKYIQSLPTSNKE